jgi:hypothetical protein
MRDEATAHRAQVLRAYENGRWRSAVWKASCVAGAAALVGLATAGRGSLLFVPVTLVLWLGLYWRGEAFLRGAIFGLAGGFVTALLPMSLLRQCCAPGMAMTAECCTMPGACTAAGGVVGIALAAVVPFGKATWWKTAAGLALGMCSIAVLRCASLFAGEAAGLLGGLLVGAMGAMAARSALRLQRS